MVTPRTGSRETAAEAEGLLVRLARILDPKGRDFGEISLSTSSAAGALVLLESPRARSTMHRAVDLGWPRARSGSLHDLVDRMPPVSGCAFRALVGGGASVYWHLRLNARSVRALSTHLGFGEPAVRIAEFLDALWGGATSFAYECGPRGDRLRFYNVIASETDLAHLVSCTSRMWPGRLASPKPQDLWLACAPKREVIVNLALSDRGAMASLKLEFPQVPLASVSKLGGARADARRIETAVAQLLQHSAQPDLAYFGTRWLLSGADTTRAMAPEFSYYVQIDCAMVASASAPRV